MSQPLLFLVSKNHRFKNTLRDRPIEPVYFAILIRKIGAQVLYNGRTTFKKGSSGKTLRSIIHMRAKLRHRPSQVFRYVLGNIARSTFTRSHRLNIHKAKLSSIFRPVVNRLTFQELVPYVGRQLHIQGERFQKIQRQSHKKAVHMPGTVLVCLRNQQKLNMNSVLLVKITYPLGQCLVECL